MKDSNVILIILDNFRYDSFDNFDDLKSFLPNFSFIKKNSCHINITSNGQATKFVMPSLFTQTFPLDYGGYNSVIKQRPVSFVELLKNLGFKTFMLQGDDNDGPESGCERGFDYVEAIYDKRLLLQNYLEEVLRYEIKFKKKDKNNIKGYSFHLKKFKNILLHIARSTNRVKRRIPRDFQKLHKNWQRKFYKEAELIENNPSIVIEKIVNVEPHLYYLLLGKKNYKTLGFFLKRKFFGLLSLFETIFFNNRYLKLKFLTFRKPPSVDEVLYSVKKIVKKENFFIFAHIMDLHDRKVIVRPFKFLKKILIWPYWFLKSKDKSFKRFLYDASLRVVDNELGNLIYLLKKNKKFNDTKIILTGDHGCEIYDENRRGKNEVFGFRTHKEHITVPLIYLNSKKKLKKKGLYDSMSISASILDDLNIKQHSSFKGKSIFKNGSDEIITENTGRGNCDILNKNVYFTVTSKEFKSMFLIKKNKLFIERLYDLKNDLNETKNIAFNKDFSKIVKRKAEVLYKKRFEIFKKRGIKKNKISNYEV